LKEEKKMKHMMRFGLAAIAALGLMALVGAGTASATTLATDAAGAAKYAVGTEVHVTLESGNSALFKETNGSLIATCTATTIKGTISTATGTWVGGKSSTLTQSGCSQTTDTLATGSVEIMKIGADEGEVVGKSSKVTLGVFGVSCVYGTAEGTKLGALKGGVAPVLVINTVLPKIEGGFLCPSTGVWVGNFVVTTPHALHFVE
jgi:hypothetical protein